MKILFFKLSAALALWVFLINFLNFAVAKEPSVKTLSDQATPTKFTSIKLATWQREKIKELLYGSENHINVLYMGNSRIARPIGFAFDGLENIAFENDRLAGNGFVIPLKGFGQSELDVNFLFNSGNSMTNTPPAWRANDSFTLFHSVGDFPALVLIPGRILKMANFGSDVLLMPRNVELKLTVQYLSGPDRGQFKITPIEVSGDTDIVKSHPSVLVDGFSEDYKADFVEIVLPVMENLELNRSFLLEGVSGESTIFRVNVLRNVSNGIALSEMAVGGRNYHRQATETSAESWTSYVRAFNPEIVFWQYAGNAESNVDLLISATKELIDRVATVNPKALHILTLDHPTPRVDWQTPYYRSRQWADALSGYRGAIVIDPEPFLPQDFLDLAGTENLGDYFDNPVHENRLGARVVFDATWEALKEF